MPRIRSPRPSSHRLRPLAPFLAACIVLALAGAAQAQLSVFDDSFESGDISRWASFHPQPIPNCNCYFSGDCEGAQFCNWGPGGPATLDICNWRNPKPNGTPGSGCSTDHIGPWGGDICDGVCADRLAGSVFGLENPLLVQMGIELWSEALLRPSAVSGGGQVDKELAAMALSLDFQWESASLILARHVADLLILTADFAFYDYFCHYENHDPDPAFFVDLSGETCKLNAGRLAIQSLLAELRDPGTGGGPLQRIPLHCPDWQTMFPERCPSGPGTLDCLENRIRDMAIFLSTPPDLRIGGVDP